MRPCIRLRRGARVFAAPLLVCRRVVHPRAVFHVIASPAGVSGPITEIPMPSISRRRFSALAGAAIVAAPVVARAQARELVIVTYPGRLSEPHRWLADQMEARHQGLRVQLSPSDSQDIV